MTFSKTSLPYKIANICVEDPETLGDLFASILMILFVGSICLVTIGLATTLIHLVFITPVASLFYSDVSFFQSFSRNDALVNTSVIKTLPVALVLYIPIICAIVWRKKLGAIVLFKHDETRA